MNVSISIIDSMEITKETLKKLKEIRKQKGLSSDKLGELVGLSGSAIRNIEAGRRKIKLETLEKIAQALGVSVAELLEEANPGIPPKLERLIRKVKFLPIVGAVKAGTPQTPIEYQYTDKAYPYIGELDCDECFVIEVDGNSMYPTLQDGDYVLIRPIEKYPIVIPENFENKVVLVANENWEYSLKRLKKIDGQWVLIPDNPSYEILKPNSEWKILGVALERLPKPEKL